MSRRLVFATLIMCFGSTAVFGAEATKIANVPQTVVDEKPRCKRYVETGSLAKMRKECHTRAEWQLLERQGKEDAKTLLWNTITGTATNG